MGAPCQPGQGALAWQTLLTAATSLSRAGAAALPCPVPGSCSFITACSWTSQWTCFRTGTHWRACQALLHRLQPTIPADPLAICGTKCGGGMRCRQPRCGCQALRGLLAAGVMLSVPCLTRSYMRSAGGGGGPRKRRRQQRDRLRRRAGARAAAGDQEGRQGHGQRAGRDHHRGADLQAPTAECAGRHGLQSTEGYRVVLLHANAIAQPGCCSAVQQMSHRIVLSKRDNNLHCVADNWPLRT